MQETTDKHKKKEIMKDIILALHKGLSVEDAKERFEKEIGDIRSTEIAELEQSLIDEGLSPDEIKKFCNVHALLFQSALEKASLDETFPSHPIFLFKAENREIQNRLDALKGLIQKSGEIEFDELKQKTGLMLDTLHGIDTHYERKEQVLFPYLEKQGFMGPSKVMWGKDNEIRDLMKQAILGLEPVSDRSAFKTYAKKALRPLIEEAEGMIFKEENILFPTALEKLSPADWVEILRESDDVGYVYIEKPEETQALMKDLKGALLEEPVVEDGAVSLPTGTLRLKEVMGIFNTLPADITFVDRDDKVAYFSDNKDRIFTRTKSVIGRQVQNCHPPQSLDVVEKILSSFKEGAKDFFEFWINLAGRRVHIRYFAVKDRKGEYLGTLEVSQDITEIQKLEGEKRLLGERD